MEWLVLFLAVAIVVGAVIWLAGRATRTRPADAEVDDDPEHQQGPRHVDLAAGMDGREPDDGTL